MPGIDLVCCLQYNYNVTWQVFKYRFWLYFHVNTWVLITFVFIFLVFKINVHWNRLFWYTVGSFKTDIDSYSQHPNQDTEPFHHPRNLSDPRISHLNLWQPLITIILYFWDYHINGIIQHVTLCNWLILT